MGTETTFFETLTDREHARRVLLDQTHQCAARLRAADRRCRVAVLKARGADFTTVTRSRTLATPTDLAQDILVLADGHCLREQTMEACGEGAAQGGPLRASSLSTLLNMVAAGYGTTMIPGLAAGAAQDAGILLRPLAARAGRTIRIAWRAHFPRRPAVEAVGEVIARRLRGFAEGAAAGTV